MVRETSELSSGEQERQVTIRLLRTIAIVVLVASAAILIADGIVAGETSTIFALAPLTALILASLYLLGRGVLWPVRLVIPVGVFIVLTYLIIVGAGTHDAAIFAYAVVLILSGLTLSINAPLIFGGLSILAVMAIGLAEMNGVIENRGAFLTGWDDLILLAIFCVDCSGIATFANGKAEREPAARSTE